MAHREIDTDVLIVGGGTGGVAAALAVARAGRKCVVTEPTDWIGGQLTSQAVPSRENRWIEYEMGVQAAPASFLRFRDEVRQWYREHRPLTPAAAANPRLNPGGGWISRLCIEPTIAHEILSRMLAAHVQAGRITVLHGYEPAQADVSGDTINALTCTSAAGETITIRAAYFLDATELGDLLPIAGAEYRIGAEGVNTFGEMHARTDGDDPLDQQAFTWCFAVEHCPEEDHTIDKPARYEWWREYVPQMSPPWPGKLFDWPVAGHDATPARLYEFMPWPQEPEPDELEMWRHRRIVDQSIYREGTGFTDVALFSMPQMDYWQKPILDVTPEQKQAAMAEAREQSLCWLYWMQTESPRFDGQETTGYPGLKLRGSELGTSDGFAKAPYIREARRLDALHIVTESEIGTEQRRRDKRPGQKASPFGMGECYFDSVGVGHYRLDLHPSTGGRNSIYAQAAPFRIPLGALIPRRMRNLLAAGKCLGVSHVTNGAFRLHPIEWNAGEAAGTLAAYCLETPTTPHAVRDDRTQLRSFQKLLHDRWEVPLAWPWEASAGLD